MGQPFSICCQSDGARPPESDMLPPPKPASKAELLSSNTTLTRSVNDLVQPTIKPRIQENNASTRSTSVSNDDVGKHPASLAASVGVGDVIDGKSAHPASNSFNEQTKFSPLSSAKQTSFTSPVAKGSPSVLFPANNLLESSLGTNTQPFVVLTPADAKQTDRTPHKQPSDASNSELRLSVQPSPINSVFTLPTLLESPSSVAKIPSLSSRSSSVSSQGSNGTSATLNTPSKSTRTPRGTQIGATPPSRGWVPKRQTPKPSLLPVSLGSID